LKRKARNSELDERDDEKYRVLAAVSGISEPPQGGSASVSANTHVSPELLALAQEIQKAAAKAPLAFNNPDLLQKQLQAIVDLKQKEVCCAFLHVHCIPSCAVNASYASAVSRLPFLPCSVTGAGVCTYILHLLFAVLFSVACPTTH
jgi:hypothetical protein